jgi:hypothetical protein
MPPAAREEYLRRFAEWRTDIGRSWRDAGAGYAVVIPGAEPLRQTVRRIIATPAGAVSGR